MTILKNNRKTEFNRARKAEIDAQVVTTAIKAINGIDITQYSKTRTKLILAAIARISKRLKSK